jgi:hypothetical protein
MIFALTGHHQFWGFRICEMRGLLHRSGRRRLEWRLCMKTTVLKTLFLASLLAIGATSAFAQSGPFYPNAPRFGVISDGRNGESRDTGYGQGGSAGTHPTGANVGPARAAMIHAN